MSDQKNLGSAGMAARCGLLLSLCLMALLAATLAATFRDGIWLMVQWWSEPEYQHGYLIPLVSLYLIWVKAAELERTPTSHSWTGVIIVFVGLACFVLGDLSAIYTLIQYGFLIALWGLVWAAIGWRGVRVIWAGLLYLGFMIPLPAFFQFNLSNLFQLWSSEIGVAFLRVVGVSVYLEGNVIDLGNYKLQVAEACSGLRYLFPLTSFAFFCAYIFRGRLWQKLLIFVSAAPITILMNSFRIAVTGVLVNRYGIDQAEGFLHYFEGWVIFVACIVLLFLEMMLLALSSGRKLAESFEVEIPDFGDFRYLLGGGPAGAPVIATLVLLVAGTAGSYAIQHRAESVPRYVSLSAFPLAIGKWSGQDDRLEKAVLDQLKLTDYALITYRSPADPRPVELYVAYYGSQRKGASVHSPRACLPSGGWQIDEFDQHEVADARAGAATLRVNRAVVSLGSNKAIVYYWFMQRGRYLTNEFAVKWYIFWDSLTKNRTDGAMVRVMTPISDAAEIGAAEKQLEDFVRAVEPRLYYQIPQEAAVAHNDAPLATGVAPR
jgi:exosortase D (VPLPA-CTERM-specific)